MIKKFFALVVLVLLSACATPVQRSETIPTYPVKPAATTAIAVVDLRSFVLNGKRKEGHEGIIRGAFGIPGLSSRSDESGEKPFALYLAGILKESVENAGGKATIVTISKGTSLDDAVAAVAKSDSDAGILTMMHESRYDTGAVTPEYSYYFDVVVLDRKGKRLVQKKFNGFDKDLEYPNLYRVHDWSAVIYKQKFDAILNDPEIKKALMAAAGSG